MLGYYDPEGRLIYAGRVGTGMSVKTLAMLHQPLAPLATSQMPLSSPPPRRSRFGGPLALSKMALDLTPSDRELCSQSTISRLENLPDVRALLRMGRAMVDLYCASFAKVPKRITLDIDDTFDAVHGGQQLRLFNAHYDE